MSGDPLANQLMNLYQRCKIGTGGMGFNWPYGSMEDTPENIVEAFLIIDRVVNEVSEEKTEQRRQDAERKALNQRL